MLLTGQKGTILIPLIIVMTLMAALGAGIYSFTASSTYSELLSNNNDNAYELAKAGVRYAVQKFQCNTFQASTYYMPDANHTFTITGEPGKITSVGIVKFALFSEAKRVIVYNNNAACGSGGGMPAGIIGTPPQFGDMPAFGNPVISNAGAAPSQQAIQSDIAGNIYMGGGVTDASGALWYQGSSVVGNCEQGACKFNIGINVYFEFTFLTEDYSNDSMGSSDGFTFAVISAVNNTNDRSGGAPPNNSMGELVGYAGPGATTDGLGLKPPKIALEFDTYPNSNADVCVSGSRNDINNNPNLRDHIAVMYWGAGTIAGSCGGYSKSSFDDNRHGAGGTGGDPRNSVKPESPDPASGYYEFAGGSKGRTCKSSGNTCNWLEDGYKYSTRIEIVRSGDGTYRFKAWILSQNPGCPSDLSDCFSSLDSNQQNLLQDIMVPFADLLPQIDRTVTLSAQDHNDFNKIYFGFTEGTGGDTQRILVENLRVFFPTGTCAYSIGYRSGTDVSHTSTSANYAASGGSGIITTGTSTTCPWIAFSLAPWIHISAGVSGMGTGDVSFSVDASAAYATRTGQINIAGQTFTVNQAAAPCPALSITTASPLPCGTAGTAYSAAMTRSGGASPYTWSAANLPAGLSINSATGIISGTPAAGGPYNNVIITLTDACPGRIPVSQAYTMAVLSIITNSPLPGGTAGTAYSTALAGSGISGTATWSISAGTLPAGLTLNSATGVINGTPTTAGTSNFTVRLADTCDGGRSVTKAFTMNIGCSSYRVWNIYGHNRPFSVGGTCRGTVNDNSEITAATTPCTLNAFIKTIAARAPITNLTPRDARGILREPILSVASLPPSESRARGIVADPISESESTKSSGSII